MQHWRQNSPLLKEWGWSIHICSLLPRLDPYSDDDLPMTHHALPGTGRMVKCYGKHHESVGGLSPYLTIGNACLQLADDFCPFIRRAFTRPMPMADRSAVIVHDDESHVTKRPLFDLDGEHKCKEQCFTEESI